MIRLQSFVAGAAAGLVMAAGFALAQGPTPFPQPDRDVIAAQDSLTEAMEHLARTRSPNAVHITRAKAYIALAHAELTDAGGVQGLQRGPE